jgi:uncharacterized Zn-finger protein
MLDAYCTKCLCRPTGSTDRCHLIWENTNTKQDTNCTTVPMSPWCENTENNTKHMSWRCSEASRKRRAGSSNALWCLRLAPDRIPFKKRQKTRCFVQIQQWCRDSSEPGRPLHQYLYLTPGWHLFITKNKCLPPFVTGFNIHTNSQEGKILRSNCELWTQAPTPNWQTWQIASCAHRHPRQFVDLTDCKQKWSICELWTHAPTPNWQSRQIASCEHKHPRQFVNLKNTSFNCQNASCEHKHPRQIDRKTNCELWTKAPTPNWLWQIASCEHKHPRQFVNLASCKQWAQTTSLRSSWIELKLVPCHFVALF